MPLADMLVDGKRIVHATLTNLIARYSPRWYLRLTAQTGRGSEEETPESIAGYFRQCFEDYMEVLEIEEAKWGTFLQGKNVIEYGPGDLPAAAMLMVAFGAESVVCVDRFPLVQISLLNQRALDVMLGKLDGPQRERAQECFRIPGDYASGLNPERIRYEIHPKGLSGKKQWADLLISRAALEHVNDLEATLDDMSQAMKPQAWSVHEVDLKSHGLHRRNPLDFLAWPDWLWKLMYGYKGFPNRLRVDSYRKILGKLNMKIIQLKPTQFANQDDIKAIRPHLCRAFKSVSDVDLSWLGFWLVFRHQ
jgi:hypothetical protein